MIEDRHLGIYGLIIKDDKILLINKVSGPYDGKLDLPGGSLEFGERPVDTLKREILEETGLEILNYELFDVDSVCNEWEYKDKKIKGHHVGVFYIINNYKNEIKKNIQIDDVNDDSLGAEFYKINDLTKDRLSKIAILELEKLGYNLK